MPNHALQILRLLRFASLMLLLGSVASASAQTVGERAKKDPGFQIYPVIFGVTATSSSTPPAVRLVEVGTPRNNGPRVGTRQRLISRTHGLKQRRRRFRQSLQSLR